MRRRRFKFRDGTFYDYGEYGISDIVPVELIRREVKDEKLKQVSDAYACGYNHNTMARKLGARILRTFIRILTEHLLDSDRIFLGYGRYLYIGRLPNNPSRTVAKRWKTNPLVHTQGKRYGIILDGANYRPYFRMPFRNRKVLADKLKKGHLFY